MMVFKILHGILNNLINELLYVYLYLLRVFFLHVFFLDDFIYQSWVDWLSWLPYYVCFTIFFELNGNQVVIFMDSRGTAIAERIVTLLSTHLMISLHCQLLCEVTLR